MGAGVAVAILEPVADHQVQTAKPVSKLAGKLAEMRSGAKRISAFALYL